MPFDHFGLIAGLYNRATPFNPPQELLDLLALPSNGLLLDAGGGTGRVAVSLRSFTKDVVVVDPSKGMLRQAKGKSLLMVCAPAESLPFASNLFDRIIMVDALHHVFNQKGTITDLWRVLAPGGIMAIIEPDIRKLSTKLIAIVEKGLLMRSHFLAGERMAAFFTDPNASVRVIINGSDVWVVSEKVR
jgi:ubiquinone/menaquinone biosynthesis C-methylase UbiE